MISPDALSMPKFLARALPPRSELAMAVIGYLLKTSSVLSELPSSTHIISNLAAGKSESRMDSKHFSIYEAELKVHNTTDTVGRIAPCFLEVWCSNIVVPGHVRITTVTFKALCMNESRES
jgi:hypothetical protein